MEIHHVLLICASLLLSSLISLLIIVEGIYRTRKSNHEFSSSDCLHLCLMSFIPGLNFIMLIHIIFWVAEIICHKIDPIITRIIRPESSDNTSEETT